METPAGAAGSRSLGFLSDPLSDLLRLSQEEGHDTWACVCVCAYKKTAMEDW